jgi:hypothetical protein
VQDLHDHFGEDEGEEEEVEAVVEGGEDLQIWHSEI